MQDEHNNHRMQSWLHIETWKMHSRDSMTSEDELTLHVCVTGLKELRKTKKTFRFCFDRQDIFVVDLSEDFLKKLKKLSQKQWTKPSFRHSAKFLTFFFNTSLITMNEFDVGTRTLKLKPKFHRVSLDDHKKKCCKILL